MPDICRLYLDQMLRYEVAQALRDESHDVLRATEVGPCRPGGTSGGLPLEFDRLSYPDGQ